MLFSQTVSAAPKWPPKTATDKLLELPLHQPGPRVDPYVGQLTSMCQQRTSVEERLDAIVTRVKTHRHEAAKANTSN